MALFGARSRSQLGVDIGASSIKIVELEAERGGYHLKTFGSYPIQQSIIRASGTELEKNIATTLADLAKQVNVSTKKAIAGLPGFSVFTSVIDFPELSGKDLQFAIESEAKKYVPAPLEEVVLDSKEIEDIDLGNGKMGKRVLIIAAPRDYVDKFVHIFDNTAFKLDALEVSSFAVSRALIGDDDITAAIVDIGSSTTDINVFSRGSLFINRSIDKGGQDITSIISKSLQIDETRAEQFKHDVDLSQATQGFQQPVPKAISPIIDAIALEVKRVIDSFTKQYARNVEKVIVTGGSSAIRGLTEYIQGTIALPVEVGNPWARVEAPVNYQKVLGEIAPTFAVACGLAMRKPQ